MRQMAPVPSSWECVKLTPRYRVSVRASAVKASASSSEMRPSEQHPRVYPGRFPEVTCISSAADWPTEGGSEQRSLLTISRKSTIHRMHLHNWNLPHYHTTAKVERSLFVSKKYRKMWSLVIWRRVRASFQNKASVWKIVSMWMKQKRIAYI